MVRNRKTNTERQKEFWSCLDRKRNGCWEWTKSVINKGYGQYWYNGKRWYVHRLAYFLTYGLFESLDVHHKCHNKICCNPKHLEQLPRDVHAKIDSANANKTYCSRGHAFTVANTYITSTQTRACRKCKALSQRKYTGLYQGGTANKLKTHCKHGHKFDVNNTYIRPNGHRACRRCKQNSKKHYAKT